MTIPTHHTDEASSASTSSKESSQIQDKLDTEKVMDFLAPLVGIQIPETSRTMVAAHLKTAAFMADIVYNTPLDQNHFEPASVFTPEE